MTRTLREEIAVLQEHERELAQSVQQHGDQVKEQRTQISDLRAQLTERDNEIKSLKKKNNLLKNDIRAHETQIEHQKQSLEEQKKSRQKLDTEVKQALAENKKMWKKKPTWVEGDDDDDGEDDDDNGEDKDDEEDGEDELPDAIHDGHTYCCSECGFEVVDGDCQSCWTKHNWDEEMGKDTTPTQNEALVQDRQLSPRGSTPMRDIGSPNIHRDYCGVNDRSEEYIELLRRGATRLMCETFCLEFNQATGIVAWADSSLYETFAGPAMQKGDFWKIHLGRRIELDDDDLDGSQFLEDLLEDALFFPLRSDLSNRLHERWETAEESPGIWVTRLMNTPEVEVIDNDSDVDDNGSDSDEFGEGEDEYLEARAKLEMRDWVQQSGAIRADAYETDEDEAAADKADVKVKVEAGKADMKAEDDKADMKAEDDKADVKAEDDKADMKAEDDKADVETEDAKTDVKAEDKVQDDLDVEMSDPGWSFNPRAADATWPTVRVVDVDADNEDVKEDKGGEGDEPKPQSPDHNGNEDEEGEYGNMAVSNFEESDTADSDFDSDEMLSGDEDIVVD